jgi:DNA transformation protein and related proteins
MSASKQFIEFIMELLHPVGAIEGNKFFGGYGIKSNATQFAMIMGNSMYFVVDERSRLKYEKLNMKPFSYQTKNGIRLVKRYFEVPGELFDDREMLLAWANESIAIAQSSSKK